MPCLFDPGSRHPVAQRPQFRRRASYCAACQGLYATFFQKACLLSQNSFKHRKLAPDLLLNPGLHLSESFHSTLSAAFLPYFSDVSLSLQDTIFDDYRISSQNNDCIAFQVDLSLLLRALRSSVAMDGDKLQVKLVKKRASLTEKSMPFLTFESKVGEASVFSK